MYVIGQEGIGEELDLIGVPHIGGPADADKVIKLGPGVKVDHDHDVAAVVVGFDQAINYYKIQFAQLCINENEGCKFIATNLDAVTHLTDEQVRYLSLHRLAFIVQVRIAYPVIFCLMAGMGWEWCYGGSNQGLHWQGADRSW